MPATVVRPASPPIPRRPPQPARALPPAALRDRNKQIAIYAVATVIAVAGMSYAAVPLYQLFCQATGYGGTTQRADEETFKNMKPVRRGPAARAAGGV